MKINLIASLGGAPVGFSFGSERVITIGREIGNTISPIAADGISRNHGKIYFKDGDWYVEDVGSMNGTFVGDDKITSPTKIAPNVKVQFGRFEMKVLEFVEEESDKAPAAPAAAPAAAPVAKPAATPVAKPAAAPVAKPILKPVAAPAAAPAAAPVAKPAQSMNPTVKATIKPLVAAGAGGIRKPVVGGAIKLPPKPGLAAGLKLPPKPGAAPAAKPAEDGVAELTPVT